MNLRKFIKIFFTICFLISGIFDLSLSQNIFNQNKFNLIKNNNQIFKRCSPLADSSHTFDVTKYYLRLKHDMISREYSANVEISFKSNQNNLSNITLHSEELEIDSVFDSVNQKLTFTITPDFLSINLNTAKGIGETGKVKIFYRYTNDTDRGFYFNEKNAFTKSEPFDARYWMPCFDEPWDKATWECEITVPERYIAASNGILIEEIDNPDSTITFRWREDHMLTTYLMCFSIAEYVILRDWYVQNGDSIPILNYVFPEDSANGIYEFRLVPEMMEFYSQIFSKQFPYDKYGHVEGYGSFSGGMEHTSITLLTNRYIDGTGLAEGTIAHELVHQWFGDMVTCFDFKNIWLNEGFATYFTEEWFRHRFGDNFFKQRLQILKNTCYRIDQGFRYSIFSPPMGYIFGRNVYDKAAWVLHMLRNMVGEDTFWQIIHEHLDRYKWGNINTEDFIKLSEEISGIELNWFFNQWIYGIGLPYLEYNWNYIVDKNKYYINLHIEQIQTNCQLFQLPLEVCIMFSDSSLINENILLTQKEEDFKFVTNKIPLNIFPDPNSKVLMTIEMISLPQKEISSYELYYPFPNPCIISKHSEVLIKFSVSEKSNVKINIYNVLGQELFKFSYFDLEPNIYIQRWPCINYNNITVSSGVYFVRMEAKTFINVKKITILR